MLKNWYQTFLIKKYVVHYKNALKLFKVKIKTKNIHLVVEFNQLQ